MRSRKYWVMGVTAALVMVSSPAVAATLSNGMLQKYEATKPSSALALVSWPLDVYDAETFELLRTVEFDADMLGRW